MQVLSRFNECDTVFISFRTKEGYASIHGPVTVSKVEICTTRQAATTAWEVTYIYTIKEGIPGNQKYYENAVHASIEQALCFVEETVHPKPKPIETIT